MPKRCRDSGVGEGRVIIIPAAEAYLKRLGADRYVTSRDTGCTGVVRDPGVAGEVLRS